MAIDLDFERRLHQGRELAPAGSLFDSFDQQVMRRVEDVRDGRDCPWPLTTAQRTFLAALRNHQGAARAVPLGMLAERCRCNPRELKAIVQELRLNFGVQIGSSRGEDNGYFLIGSREEAIESTAPMLHQALTMLQVVRRVRGEAQTTDQLLHQIALDLQPGEDRRG